MKPAPVPIPSDISPLEQAFYREITAAKNRVGSVAILCAKLNALLPGQVYQERNVRRWLKQESFPPSQKIAVVLNVISKVI